MTARDYYDPDAGEWVAYRDEPKRRVNRETKKYEPVPGETQRVYLWSATSGTTALAGLAHECVRFGTKAEAMTAARRRWPSRVKGCQIGAERIPRSTDATRT